MRVNALPIFIALVLHTVHSGPKLPDAITFPEEVLDVIEDPCEGLTFCTIKPKDYPQETFDEMFKNHTVLHRPSPVMEVVSRIEGDEDDDNNCKSIVTYETLYRVRESKKDDWLVVIQVPSKKFVQKVRMETCLNSDVECFTMFPGLIKRRCLQRYADWKVLVYNDERNKQEVVTVAVPSCCSCH